MSSSSSNGGANKHGRWTNHTSCRCPREHAYSVSITWEEVHMMDEEALALQTGARIGVGILTLGLSELVVPPKIKAATHDAIDVAYKCEKCGCEWHRTYELNNTTKLSRDGCYMERFRTVKKATNRLPYETIERCYYEMDGHYDVVTHNCRTWAKDLYHAVVGLNFFEYVSFTT